MGLAVGSASATATALVTVDVGDPAGAADPPPRSRKIAAAPPPKTTAKTGISQAQIERFLRGAGGFVWGCVFFRGRVEPVMERPEA
ncbi:MAG: hypothetical protein SVV67_11135, partial [Bacillota bacterium]|nr:hypothetical protein [Bacillota bacterium]